MDQRWGDAMTLALNLAANSPCPDPNPRVGCVIVADGQVVGQGWHHGAGTSHAEVEALHQAGDAARGATAVVTLEPCNHTGRTGPCSHALREAGVSRVVIAQSDPNPVAVGGEQFLRTNGVEVITGVLSEAAMALNADWTFSQSHPRRTQRRSRRHKSVDHRGRGASPSADRPLPVRGDRRRYRNSSG